MVEDHLNVPARQHVDPCTVLWVQDKELVTVDQGTLKEGAYPPEPVNLGVRIHRVQDTDERHVRFVVGFDTDREETVGDVLVGTVVHLHLQVAVRHIPDSDLRLE